MSSTLLSGKSVFLKQQNELIVVASRCWSLYLNLQNHYANNIQILQENDQVINVLAIFIA